jgi:hypothetical protein
MGRADWLDLVQRWSIQFVEKLFPATLFGIKIGPHIYLEL